MQSSIEPSGVTLMSDERLPAPTYARWLQGRRGTHMAALNWSGYFRSRLIASPGGLSSDPRELQFGACLGRAP